MIKNFNDFINEQQLNEGTTSHIGKIDKKGNIESVYFHYDGYPDYMLPVIMKNYKNGQNVDLLIKKGGGKQLKEPYNIQFYGDEPTQGRIGNFSKYLKNVDYDFGAEFIYLYDERDGKWYFLDVRNSKTSKLEPVYESEILNEGFKKNQEIEYTGPEIEVWKSKDGKVAGEKIKIKKGDKGKIVRHNAGFNYYVDFDGAKFYLNDSDFK